MRPISPKILFNQTTSQAALMTALYSASVEDKATVGCFLLIHEMIVGPMLKVYPVVDFLSSLQFA